MATDWSARTAALKYFETWLKTSKRVNDDDKEMIEQAVHALRRSQDHTAIQNKLNDAMKLIRKIASNPDCGSATCGLDCKEFLAAVGKREQV
jgi:hypothetical protein